MIIVFRVHEHQTPHRHRARHRAETRPSETLLGTAKEMVILHNGREVPLRLTQTGN